MITLLAAEPAVTFSIFKPLFITLMLIGWGRWAALLDKDAEFFYLKRRLLNCLTVGTGIVAFGLWLLIPNFWIGLLIVLILIISAGVAYAMIRNPQVPPTAKWELNGKFLVELLAQRRQSSAQQDTTLRFVLMGSKTQSNFKPVPMVEDPAYKAHLTTENILNIAMTRHAQRIEIGISGSDVVIQFNVDGVGYKAEPIPPAEALAMIDYLKRETGQDVEDRRRKQVGEVKAEIGEYGLHDFRVSTAGSTRGLSCLVEIDPRRQLEIPYEKIGLLESQLTQLKPVLEDTEGVVLVAAPARQGRTVTLYSLIQQHDPYLTDIHTLEHPIELDIEGVTQNMPTDESWPKALNTVILKDPAVIMVGQLPDTETAKLIATAAGDHKRVYVGVKGDDTFSALKAWAKALGDLNVLADTLHAVVGQRLVRKLCPTCRVAYTPDPAAMKKLNLPAERIGQLFKSSGKVTVNNKTETCGMCMGVGYLGRTAAFEVMVIDDEGRQFLRSGDLNGLRSHLRKKKMLWLQEAALAKVVSGETSITEVMRALGNEGQKG